jgi:hypothetical protein
MKKYVDNQHSFILFVFDIFGFLAPEAVSSLQRVQKVMTSNIAFPRTVNTIFKIISFVIQKGLTTQHFVRLTSVHM